MDKFTDLSGQELTLENGQKVLVCSHNIVSSENNYVGTKGVKNDGFHYNQWKVSGFRIISRGFLGLERLYSFESEINLYIEMDYFFLNNIQGKKRESLVIRFPDNFPYKIRELVEFRGGPRVVLGMDYIDLLGFRINFSKIIGGDDLEVFSSASGLLGYVDRERFIDNLSSRLTVEVSTLDFKVE